ncbi:3-oxo-tetronate kinase [Clostridiales bacterium]|nr:3-oxo-tetronate kinase [Clostridiales bacterium]
MGIIWGCIADDYMGAIEAASSFSKGGLKTTLYFGIPDKRPVITTEAVVIALKIRRIDKKEAAQTALRALVYLINIGSKHFYYKYGSYFDSTPIGNIGPVSDAIMDALGEKKAVICPASLDKKCIVSKGRMLVDGVPLAEANPDPEYPMWESEIAELLGTQSRRPCINVDREEMEEEIAEIWNRLNEFEKLTGKYYIIPDFAYKGDAFRITEIFSEIKFFSGSSGIIEALAQRDRVSKLNFDSNAFDGNTLIISGSCSHFVQDKVGEYISAGGNAFKIDVIRLFYEKLKVSDLWKFVSESGGTAMVYSTDTAENVKYNKRHGERTVPQHLLSAISELAETAVENGYTRLIIAGSETFEAIINKLDYKAFDIDETIENGIPVITPLKNKNVRIIAIAGDMGGRDIFKSLVS